jgi:tRNA pseudouridine55 synthase
MGSFSQAVSAWGLLDGVLLIDKPAGPTSHDVVRKIRRRFAIRKVGHGGTLDPNATGLLVILLGKGTKLSDRFLGSDKAYSGIARLGRVTDTQDCDGKVLEENPWRGVTREQLETAVAENFCGDIFQTPPMVSAIKSNGVPLYKLARKGVEVERKARLVHVYRFVVTEWAPPLVSFEIDCTKGTYVRTLVHDLGRFLGCGACLDALRRTGSGPFNVKDAAGLEEVLSWSEEQLAARIIPFSRALNLSR